MGAKRHIDFGSHRIYGSIKGQGIYNPICLIRTWGIILAKSEYKNEYKM